MAPAPDPLVGDPIVVVEPHADDAFLSLGWSIRSWVGEGRRVHIVTVYSDDPIRHAEAEGWARQVGASWQGLAMEATPPVGFRLPEQVPSLPSPLLPPEWTADGVCRIWPLGLSHPEHVEVSRAARPGDLHYVDTPYQLEVDAQDQVRARLGGRRIAWWCRPDPAKWLDVGCFTSQALLFELYPTTLLEGTPEIVVDQGLEPR